MTNVGGDGGADGLVFDLLEVGRGGGVDGGLVGV